jgi:uncharacterized LabA/DUF88 family protein
VTTGVYIDGFNFYYGCFKRPQDPLRASLASAKWVDVRALAASVFPRSQIGDVHYFTARVEGDPLGRERQNVCLRALEAAGVHVHYGRMVRRTRTGLLVSHPELQERGISMAGVATVDVWEEKGSDVHLGARLVRDAFLDAYEQAMVISNDADLVPAIRIARMDVGKPVHVVSPRRTIAAELRSVASSARALKRTLLPLCQLPEVVSLPDGGHLVRSREWSANEPA